MEQTTSTPTTANFSPEEIESDLTPVVASPSVATEVDKKRAVGISISETSEDATSNIITPNDWDSEECDKIVIPTTAEVRCAN